MSRVTLVLPGARAGRRLLELLTEPKGVFVPPRIITIGSLPEMLHTSERAVASPLQSLLARAYALRCADRASLELIIPSPPDDGDLVGWLTLARDLARLDDELAAESLGFDQVIAECEKRIDFNDSPRWHAIASLHDAYRETLQAHDRCDVNMARARAIDQRLCRCEDDIILIALTDLTGMVRRMLAQVIDRVTCLVHAPESERDGFDQLGCVIAQHWCDRTIALDDEAIHIVNRPRDQAMQVLRIIGSPDDEADARTLRGRYRAAQITIGMGDDTLAGPVQRTLALADLPAHWAGGRPIAQSRPGLLLKSIAAFVRHQRLDDFASLLRHPDIEHHLLATIRLPRDHPPEPPEPEKSQGETGEAASSSTRPARRAIDHWLTLLDRYISEHLSSRQIGRWLGKAEDGRRLKRIYDAVLALLPDSLEMRRPLPSWAQPMADLLGAVYAHASLDPQQRDDADLIRAIEAIADGLREQAALDPQDVTTPIVSFADAIALTLAQLTGLTTPAAEPPGGDAIELLGWLELMLDDAPALIITGFNEHHVPQSASADAFLPNHLRQSLGLTDNIRRYTRDAASLTAMLHSKPFLAIIAGRRGHDDEPLAPSRLLLTEEGRPLAQRILRFYPREHPDETDAHAMLALAGTNRFLIPAPKPPRKPVEKMSVTWFKHYLACPYRFYLRFIERLEAMDDRAIEIDGMRFGTMVHDVMKTFGASDLRDSRNAPEIAAFFHDALRETAAQMLGDEPPVAARLQLLQLEERLGALAQWQAQQVQQGWRIVPELIECDAQAVFETEDGAVTVHGRIDRIDRHEQTGNHRIIDYKTGDAGDGPEKTHRKNGKEGRRWIDLQLPLYHHLAQSLNITGAIELGYVLLPKKLESIGFEAAEWSLGEIEDGIDKARQVIAAVRAGIFWPPGDAPRYADEFSALCMDDSDRRDAIIEAITRQMGGGR